METNRFWSSLGYVQNIEQNTEVNSSQHNLNGSPCPKSADNHNVESLNPVTLKKEVAHLNSRVIIPNRKLYLCITGLNHLTCAVKKAGVREPDGRAGLLRAMEPMSLPASSRGGAEISRALGFLLFGGSPSPWLLLLLAELLLPLLLPLLSGGCRARSLCPEERLRG